MDSSKKNSLLIVDDDKLNLLTLSKMLQPDYNIYTAADGKTALRIANTYTPDLVILDVLMPDMDGFQVFTELRDSEKTSQIPVIFITGLNSKEDERRCLRMGAVDYIAKPFDDMVVHLRVRHQMRIINQLRTIEHLSMVDQLTGIPNRRNFDNRLHAEWGRSIREKVAISLMIMDVDFFKNYNDTYGHQQGDVALRAVADIMKDSLKRASDFAARWGGEEFVVLLPNTDAGGSVEIAEKIRMNIEAAEIRRSDGPNTKITVSIGVNAFTPMLTSSLDEFISRADKALYDAKNTGRNKVCLYE